MEIFQIFDLWDQEIDSESRTLNSYSGSAEPRHTRWGLRGQKIFDFDNPRSLEKALSGKELH